MSESGFAQLIPLILIFVIFYFFLIRPQQKKVKEHKLMVENLKRGDKVITSGGIIGKVDRVMEDDRIELIKRLIMSCTCDLKWHIWQQEMADYDTTSETEPDSAFSV